MTRLKTVCMHDAIYRLYQEFFNFKAEFHEIQNLSTAFVQIHYKKFEKIGQKFRKHRYKFIKAIH